MRIDPELLKDSAESAKDSLLKGFDSLKENGLEEALQDKILKWMLDTQRSMEQVFPYSEEYRSYENCYADSIKGRTTAVSFSQDLRNCSAIGEATRERWLGQCSGADHKQLMQMQSVLLKVWKNDLEKKKRKWELDILERRRLQFVDSMETWLRFIESAKNTLEAMGVGTGILWDLSQGEGVSEDHSILLQWTESFRKDVNLRKLCDMLGREIISSRISREQKELSVSDSRIVHDRVIREEMSGVETGNRIEDLLPSELGLIDDPELSVLFDLKYAENALMNFSKEGYSSVEFSKTQMVQTEKDDGCAGPIILCIDTSGSMRGTPEYIAKGVTLFLAMRAHAEKRRCYLINFSTGIRTVDISPDMGIGAMLDLLSFSFNGGTDIKPALERAVDTLQREEYVKADVLTVSDFVMPPNSLDYLAKYIDSSRERECRFHSLLIGSFAYAPNTKDVFDVCWEYNPANHSIKRK